MPATYVIDQDRRLVISTGSGLLTGAEVLDHQTRLSTDPLFQPGFCQLIDCTGVTATSVDVQTIRHLTSKNIFDPESRRAAVVSSSLTVGVMRMIASYAEISGRYKEIRIFRDREEALAWLRSP